MFDNLSAIATRRNTDLFRIDLDSRRDEITGLVRGKRVLVIGGAGSIGSSTVRALLEFYPRALHIVDQNENSLAELIRDLRSAGNGLRIGDFRCLLLDFGSPVMQKFIGEMPPYDFILNFAAVKHVRSEKDAYSVLQMLDTNVVKPTRLLNWLKEKTAPFDYFCVSTDKAANPVNLMGASKRMMEHVIFNNLIHSGQIGKNTSARFANVAFSDGSLLYGFVRRMEKHQPLAVPVNTRRFFISLQESGQICLLAAICAEHRHLLIPRMHPSGDLHDLQTIAEDYIRFRGFKPRHYHVEDQARDNIENDLNAGYYPLLLTPLDTSGEKPYEEFVGENETSVEIGMSSLLAVSYLPCSQDSLQNFLEFVGYAISKPDAKIAIDDISAKIAEVIPEFKHNRSANNLDERM